MKETNRQYTVNRSIKFGISELYAFYKAKMTPSRMRVKKDDVIYPSLKKMIYKIKGFWNNDPELLMKFENIFRQKEEVKENGGAIREIKPAGSEEIPDMDSDNNM